MKRSRRSRVPDPALPSSEAAHAGVLHAQAVMRAALAVNDERLWFLASLETRPEVLTYSCGRLAIAVTHLAGAYAGDPDARAVLERYTEEMSVDAEFARATLRVKEEAR